MRILFISAEATPLAKVGGLADVIGSLPKALCDLGHDVRIMMPGYSIIDTIKYPSHPVINNLNIDVMKTTEAVALEITKLTDKVKVYLVKNQKYFGSGNVYKKDDLERFLFFCRCVVEILPGLDWQPEIVHCHDWHTALIPLWLKKKDYQYATVFTIHNLAYQGSFDRGFLVKSALSEDWQSMPEGTPKIPFNFMSQGIIWADVVNTVSETYAREILTPEYGQGLESLLKYREGSLFGIVNGLDYDEYNPATDSFIPSNYDSSTLDKRIKNKIALQKYAGLHEDSENPLIGLVSRLDKQKGFDIVVKSFEALLDGTQPQIVILGTGNKHYHTMLKKAANEYAHQVAIFLTFDNALAHLIYAGCDIFLMPSRFEPCGLGQLIAMRYGAVPVVRHTGGLADTVKNLNDDFTEGSGFVFNNYSARAMSDAVRRAIGIYRKKESWEIVKRKIMNLDFSWQASAKKYESLYYKSLGLKDCVEN